MTKKKSITNEKKLACLVAILPVMMDFMEDIKDEYPHIYKRQVKKAGNDFIAEVDKMGYSLNKRIVNESDDDLMEFYTELVNMGIIFREWLAEL